MISEVEMKIIEDKLNTHEYITFDKSDFKISNSRAWKEAIFNYFLVLIGGTLILMIFDTVINKNILGIINMLIQISAIIFAIKTLQENSYTKEFQDKITNLQKDVVEHNKNVYTYLLMSELEKYEISNLTKEVVLYYNDYIKEEKVGVNDTEKYLAYYIFNLYIYNGKTSATIQKAYYKDIIKYELIDKSTTTQTATSVTSSNSGKAIGGAIVTGLLMDDTTTGAIIGGSGGRKTETKYKTSVEESYQIIIYLNSLENSTITINTKYRNKVNDIVAMLEYILRNQNWKLEYNFIIGSIWINLTSEHL